MTPPSARLPPAQWGNVLVALQLLLLAALLVLALPAFLHGVAPLVAWLLLLAGIALGAWALGANRPGNFNIHPAPRAGGRLVQGGPYRWIRHPMYSAVITCGLACAWAAASLWGWLAWPALLAVLDAKARLEERWLTIAHPGYAGYRKRTRRFVPGAY
jgi:protein-S-isoprenylcysteine O-methyltransferase Ste14